MWYMVKGVDCTLDEAKCMQLWQTLSPQYLHTKLEISANFLTIFCCLGNAPPHSIYSIAQLILLISPSLNRNAHYLPTGISAVDDPKCLR